MRIIMRINTPLAVLLTLVALLLGLAAAAPAGAEVIPPGSPAWGKIYGLESSPANCVDVEGGSSRPGTPIDVYYCHNDDNQQWQYRIGNNTILSAYDGCLDVVGGGTSDGTPVDLYNCNGTGAQVWRIIGQTLYNPQSGKCLDDTAYGGPGTPLEIWDCNGGSNQNWDIIGYTS
jgi:hypothetical protein